MTADKILKQSCTTRVIHQRVCLAKIYGFNGFDSASQQSWRIIVLQITGFMLHEEWMNSSQDAQVSTKSKFPRGSLQKGREGYEVAPSRKTGKAKYLMLWQRGRYD